MKQNSCIKKNIIAALSVFLAFQIGHSRELTVNEALSIAKQKTNISVLRSSRNGYNQLQLVHTEKVADRNTIYVLNNENGGYILLSADDAAVPVLGYSDEGVFDIKEMPENMQSLLKSYSIEIAATSNNGDNTYAGIDISDLAPIEPMITSSWLQGAPYYNMCPKVIGAAIPCPAGCAAITISQIMRYHKWPEKGIGTHSYNWINKGTYQTKNETLSFDFENTTFEWDQMLDSYTGNYTQQQVDAAATLVYAAGIAINMDYGRRASSAKIENIGRGLIENFGYDKAISYIRRKYFTITQWTKKLHDELSQNGPMYYNAQNESGSGHGFVVDGYDGNGYFHINWGWGHSDGYFKLTAFDTESYSYNNEHGAFFGIKKAISGSKPTAEFVIEGNFQPKEETYDRSAIINFLSGKSTEKFYPWCIYPVSGVQIGVKLVNENNKTEYLWMTGNPMELESREGTPFLEIEASRFPSTGSYTVTPAVKWGEEIRDILVPVDKNRELKLVATEQQLKFIPTFTATLLDCSEIDITEQFTPGKEYSFKTVITNSGTEYNGEITPILSSENAGMFFLPKKKIYVAKDYPAEVEWNETLDASVPHGDGYTLYLLNNNGDRIGQPVNVTVNDPAGIESVENSTNCTVYPNPAKTVVNITADTEIKQITIYSLAGNEVLSESFDGTNCKEQLKVDQLPAGYYISKIKTVNGQHTVKLIKQ